MRYSCFCTVLLICIGVQSCVGDAVPYKHDDDAPVIVNCVLEFDSEQTLHLEYLRDLSGNIREPVPVTDAGLFVTIAGQLERVASFECQDPYTWKTEYYPEFGRTYYLKITVPGNKEITASTQFPVPVNFRMQNDIALQVRNKAQGKEYYSFEREHQKGKIRTAEVYGSVNMYIQTEEDCVFWFFAVNVDKDGRENLCRKIAAKHLLADNFNVANEVYTRKGGDYFSDWPLEGLPLHYKYIRIDCPLDYDNGYDNLWDDRCTKGLGEWQNPMMRKNFSLAGDFVYGTLMGQNQDYIVACNVSKEYDMYLKEMMRRLSADNSSFLSLYSGHDVYTNITNGYGVFGAVASYKIYCGDASEKSIVRCPIPVF